MSQGHGTDAAPTPVVLFVCVHNAGRSQMAARLLEHHARGRIRVRSRGSAPAESVNPVVVQAMAELGLDMTEAVPARLDDEAIQEADVVVTMGCGDACHVFPGRRYEDWQVDDPAGADLSEVRRIRDDIESRVIGLRDSLLADQARSRV